MAPATRSARRRTPTGRSASCCGSTPDKPGDYELAAIGLRNPWRYSFDPRTNELWIGDVGQDTFEEIDAAPLDDLGPDLNFGWSAFEGTDRFNDDQQAPNARPPVLEYGRDGGCSVTGGYVVRDPQLESLLGRYLYGDFCEGELRSFPADPAKHGGRRPAARPAGVAAELVRHRRRRAHLRDLPRRARLPPGAGLGLSGE